MYRGKIIKKLFVSAIFIVIIFVSESMLLGLLYILNFGTPDELLSDGIGRVIGMTGSKILYFWCSFYVCQFLKTKIKEISARNWAAIIAAPLFSIVILNSIFISSDVSNKSMLSYIISVIGILLLNFFVFNYFETYRRQLKIAVMEKLIETDEQNYKLIEDKYNEMRQLKHDIRNQINIAKQLFQSDKAEGMTHLNLLSDELAKSDGICCIGIPVIDAIINLKMKEAADNGIKCITKINADKSICTDKMALCRILANTLDNAIEACIRNGGNNKFIYFVLSQQDKNLFIRISNSSHSINVDNPETEKCDKGQHGLGLMSVRTAVKQLNGIMNMSYENNIFTIELLLNC
jgi:hypothetical protein